MKITKEHVGKKVRRKDTSRWIEVLAVDGDEFWGRVVNTQNRSAYGCADNSYQWELYQEPFMIDGKEVKVGDRIANKAWGAYSYIKFQSNDEEFVYAKNGSHYPRDISWRFYQDPKTYKIVSPAVICEQSYQITTQVYETEEKARLEWPTSFHSWPACDANGNPIQYRVEVKE